MFEDFVKRLKLSFYNILNQVVSKIHKFKNNESADFYFYFFQTSAAWGKVDATLGTASRSTGISVAPWVIYVV